MSEESRASEAGAHKPGRPKGKARSKHNVTARVRSRKAHSLSLDPEHESAVLDRAVDVIGDKSEAMRWLGVPVRALDYATPISLIHTRKGRKAVMTTLSRLEYGVL